jgi:hypothetical protein
MTLVDAIAVFIALFVLGFILRRFEGPSSEPCEWHKWSYTDGLYTCGPCGKVAGDESDSS